VELRLSQYRASAHFQQADFRIEKRPVDLLKRRSGDNVTYPIATSRRSSWSSHHPYAETTGRLIFHLSMAITTDGGTHLSAFREAFLKGSRVLQEDYSGLDVREGTGRRDFGETEVAGVRVQTKNKLGNTKAGAGSFGSQVRGGRFPHKRTRKGAKAWKKKSPEQNTSAGTQSVKRRPRSRKTHEIKSPISKT